MTGNGSQVLFFGQIHNRRAIRSELQGVPEGDEALYAAAFDRWGEDVDLRLCGDYSTILVEAHAPRVRISRSPISAPAVYYWYDQDRLIVANSPAALFATGKVPRELDDQKLADSLFLNYTDESRGWFRNVARLPRGARAWCTPGKVDVAHYYQFADVPEIRFAREADYVEAADALFKEAVENCLDGFERPAISLSGGLDSQAVAAYAMRLRPDRPLLGFTSVPLEGWSSTSIQRFDDERPGVEALAAMYPQLQTNWVEAQSYDMSHFLREMFEIGLCPPRNAANLYWIHEVHRQAKAKGADVLLTGALGNLTFSYDGSGAIPGYIRRGRLLSALREVWHAGPASKAHRRFVHQAILPFLPRDAQMAAYRLAGSPRSDELQTWSPLLPEYASRMRVRERAVEFGFDPQFQPPSSPSHYRRMLLGNAACEGGDISLAFDRLHGIPKVDPTAYRPLLEFCYGIPIEQYIYRGKRRRLARRLLKDKIPEAVAVETRRGRQAADWPMRLRRRRPQVLAELEWLENDPDVASRIDIGRLRKAVEQMPENDADITDDQRATLQLALSRGLATARFIRYINGRNDF